MKVGILHEHVTDLLRSIVGAVTIGVGIRCFSSGRATRKTRGLDRGLQPDLSYSFDPEKVRMANEAIARRSDDPADYPVPDLAIDADDGSCEIDRRGIYAALGVAEVWRSDGKTVAIERLRPDGSYAPALESRFLPISAEDVRRWLVEEDGTRRPDWDLRLIRWAMALGGRA